MYCKKCTIKRAPTFVAYGAFYIDIVVVCEGQINLFRCFGVTTTKIFPKEASQQSRVFFSLPFFLMQQLEND
jgi:hypothetical protein